MPVLNSSPSNTTTDPDGAGPATARPAIVPFNANTVTSATLVMKIDHTKAGTSPGGDWWFATEGLQDSAVGFMWINPNLAASEASQFTPWAAWRSGNASYSGVSFITDTDAVDLNFSNIAIYTGRRHAIRHLHRHRRAPPPRRSSASPVAVPADGIIDLHHHRHPEGRRRQSRRGQGGFPGGQWQRHHRDQQQHQRLRAAW